MTRRLARGLILLSFATLSFAHRLDEYLQATIISVQKDHLQAFMRLTPGVAVASLVTSTLDTNGDGIISETEGQTYAGHVLRDLSLSIDGHPLRPRLVSVDVPKINQMRQGLGEIQIEFTANLPKGGANRQIIFANHHGSRISAYLVNCLVPQDKNIRLTAQDRNENQSFYQLSYAQTGGHRDFLSPINMLGIGTSLGAVALLLLATLAVVERQRKKVEVPA